MSTRSSTTARARSKKSAVAAARVPAAARASRSCASACTQRVQAGAIAIARPISCLRSSCRFASLVNRVNVPGMKGNEQVLDLLNDLLTNELTAINQYFVHAKMCENWGYDRLAHKIREESIDEMKHADQLISRILFLEGVPN